MSWWQGIIKIKNLAQDDEFDKETSKIMNKFQDEYLQHGWEIVSLFTKILSPVMFLIILLFLSPDNLYYWRGIFSYPLWFILAILVDKFYCSNKKLAEMFLMIFIVISGLAIVSGNLKKNVYYFNEHWTWFILITQYIYLYIYNI